MTKGTCYSSMALIPGSRNETTSHRNASRSSPHHRIFHNAGGLWVIDGQGPSLVLVRCEMSTHIKEPVLKSLGSPEAHQVTKDNWAPGRLFLLPSH